MSDFEEYSLTGYRFDDSPQAAPEVGLAAGRSADSSALGSAGAIPPRVDLRKYCSEIEDQKRTNSCVANAEVGALELLQARQGHPRRDLSRLFVYFNSRRLHGNEIKDEGTFVHTAMAALIAHGVCEEKLWPLSELTVNDPPTQACYENAQHYGGIEFARMKASVPIEFILAEGIPVVIGVTLPRECYVEAHKTGVMPLPENVQQSGEPFRHSGHAMLVVGYDLESKHYILRNSWGRNYAKDGYFMMPFAIMQKHSRPERNWAIGGLTEAPGLELLGRSVKESVEGMVSAAVAPRIADTSGLRKGVNAEFESRLDKARSGFRNRLRGN